MTPFERFHPAIQHHIVNSLGWPSLRPLQEEAIGPILDEEHALLIAPTAGGKTEAAFFPVVSRMLMEAWSPLSVIYVCPIKALLNNLEERLRFYATLLGRRVELWHGDVTTTRRRHILGNPPDILLTTPESIEVILTSARSRKSEFLHSVRAVIVDEIHAFAGDDRGWHLLAVLERVEQRAGRRIQRLGLSATVGNPGELLRWLTMDSDEPARVIAPGLVLADNATTTPAPSEITLDYVGELGNAATVISRLHRGEKRLVFCDSRNRVEKLAARLRQLEVDTYVSHSSLSVDERRRAEDAFSQKQDCVIVATSTLELGLDVGDLDRVIQIDSPGTVASFLQRIGRTGRRPGTTRNCLFLTTAPSSFLRAAGLLRLWASGWVEPVRAPAVPYHVLVQQILGLVLQEGGTGRHTWSRWLGRFAKAASIPPVEVEEMLDFMIREAYLGIDQDLIHLGAATEKEWGHRNFMELCSVFSSEPMFAIFHGNTLLGQVHPMTFFVRSDAEPTLLLAGMSWKVTYIDWFKERAFVEPTEAKGRSRWLGDSQPVGYSHCQAVKQVLLDGVVPVNQTQRAVDLLSECLGEFQWVDADSTAVLRSQHGALHWCTFGGLRANAMLSTTLGDLVDPTKRPDNLAIALHTGVSAQEVEQRVTALGGDPPGPEWVPIDQRAIDALKFSSALPPGIAEMVLKKRGADVTATLECLRLPRRFIDLSNVPEVE